MAPSSKREGRRMVATPQSRTLEGPMLMWGGASLPAARRAGRNGLGLLANGVVPGMREAYEKACRDHGHEPGFVLLPDRETVTNCFVADDVDAAWDEIGAYLLHDAWSYAECNPDNAVSANINHVETGEELRATSRTHVILSTGEAARRAAAGEMFNVFSLCGGYRRRSRGRIWSGLPRSVSRCRGSAASPASAMPRGPAASVGSSSATT